MEQPVKSLRSMVKGSKVLLVVPGVGWGVETVGGHVGIDRVHGHVSNSANGSNTSGGHRDVLGVL